MRKNIVLTWLLLLFLFPSSVLSEAQIKQFFPARSVLLGQPQFWIVEIRHPMWESYELKFGSCPDLKMSIANRAMSDVAGEIRTVYKIAVTPLVFKQSCTPTMTISDEKGQTTVLNGKPLRVRKISGDSLLIKNPALPVLRQRSSLYYFFLFSLLGILVVLCAIFAAKRFYNNLPSQRFLRDVRRAGFEVRKGRLPIQVWRLLRSEMIWEFDAEAYTPAQLHQRATNNQHLLRIAVTLQSLESWRYSGSNTTWDHSLVGQALANAEALVESKSPFNRFKRSAKV
ncbi:MAG: hypothetical protein ACRD4B_08380 [Acidobacteriota bacterium]